MPLEEASEKLSEKVSLSELVTAAAYPSAWSEWPLWWWWWWCSWLSTGTVRWVT